MRKAKKIPIEDTFVSVVVPTDRDTKNLAKYVTQIATLLQARYYNYEIIVVDNYLSVDELNKTTPLLKTTPCIRIVRLSRATDKDTAVYSGLEAAIGDTVVILTPNADPVNLITKFVDRNKESDIIFGITRRSMRKGVLNRYGAELFYWYNRRYLNISIPARSTYYMAFNRRAVNSLTRTNRSTRHIRYLARQIGYSMTDIEYDSLQTAVPEKKSAVALFSSALDLTTNYSFHPLRLVSRLGALAAVINLAYCLYIIYIRAFSDDVAAGWTTLSLQSAVMFLLVFLILAVLSEYVGKILEESRNDAPYHIMDELSSTISIADTTRRNIKK